jgi:hypothetical protein
VFVVFFHPCCLAGLRKTFQLFSKSYWMAVNSLCSSADSVANVASMTSGFALS